MNCQMCHQILTSSENSDLCRDCLMLISHVNNRTRSEILDEDVATIRTLKINKRPLILEPTLLTTDKKQK